MLYLLLPLPHRCCATAVAAAVLHIKFWFSLVSLLSILAIGVSRFVFFPFSFLFLLFLLFIFLVVVGFVSGRPSSTMMLSVGVSA